ncbi:hypothetical protein RAS2_15350 [Phycisphaerae bacterium RAS2]|nr:hypothetical protein RAS2_15350 [Phycisphaerae bacterium RAS2]
MASIRLSVKVIVNALAALIATSINGCCYMFPPCEVDEQLVGVDMTKTPSVSDQVIEGCYSALVERVFGDENERQLILRAEALPSTIGPQWQSQSRTSSFGYAFPDALTDEALAFYASRIRSFQTGEGDLPCRASVYYRARVIPQEGSSSGDPGNRKTVRLEIAHDEIRGPTAASGIVAWREVDFDATGEVVDVRGDGEATEAIS